MIFYEFNIAKLAADVRQARGETNLRDQSEQLAALDLDVSPSTFSRVEREKYPDLETLLALCSWLGTHPADYFLPPQGPYDTDERRRMRLAAQMLRRAADELDNGLPDLRPGPEKEKSP